MRGLLESWGITCIVKNERLDVLAGQISFCNASAELWVNDTDYEQAEKILADEENT